MLNSLALLLNRSVAWSIRSSDLYLLLFCEFKDSNFLLPVETIEKDFVSIFENKIVNWIHFNEIFTKVWFIWSFVTSRSYKMPRNKALHFLFVSLVYFLYCFLASLYLFLLFLPEYQILEYSTPHSAESPTLKYK